MSVRLANQAAAEVEGTLYSRLCRMLDATPTPSTGASKPQLMILMKVCGPTHSTFLSVLAEEPPLTCNAHPRTPSHRRGIRAPGKAAWHGQLPCVLRVELSYVA